MSAEGGADPPAAGRGPGAGAPQDRGGRRRTGRPDRAAGTVVENRRPALLAGALVGAAGLLDFLAGFATTRAEPYVVMTNREMVHLHTAAWGRLHLLIGLAALVAGLVIALGPRWATVLGLGAVAAGSVADLLFLPYDPLRELLAVGFEIAAVVVLVRNRRLPGGRPGRRTRA